LVQKNIGKRSTRKPDAEAIKPMAINIMLLSLNSRIKNMNEFIGMISTVLNLV